MPAFFERMQRMNRANETNLPEFLATHPVTTARIADARGRAEQYTYRQVPDTLDFQLVRAKLRVMMPGDTSDAVRAFLTDLAVKQNVAAATQNQAFHALLFLYRQVLKVDLAEITGVERAKVSRSLPVVFTMVSMFYPIGRL